MVMAMDGGTIKRPHDTIGLVTLTTRNVRLDKTKFQVFSSFAEAEEADRQFYRSLTPDQRLAYLILIRDQYRPYSDELTEGFKRVYKIIKRS